MANHVWRCLEHHSESQSREFREIVESTIPIDPKQTIHEKTPASKGLRMPTVGMQSCMP